MIRHKFLLTRTIVWVSLKEGLKNFKIFEIDLQPDRVEAWGRKGTKERFGTFHPYSRQAAGEFKVPRD